MRTNFEINKLQEPKIETARIKNVGDVEISFDATDLAMIP